MTLQDFVNNRKQLFWGIKDPANLSDNAIVEAILNYGDFDDVKLLFEILTIKKAADIFNRQIKSRRCNYRPKIKNYFSLYFNKYA